MGQGFQIYGKNLPLPLRRGLVIRRMHAQWLQTHCPWYPIWEMSELITQGRIGVGTSNSVKGLNMYDHWSRSKGPRSSSQGHLTYQQQERYRQRMVVSTSNLVEIFTVRGETCDTLSGSVSQVEIWRTFSL